MSDEEIERLRAERNAYMHGMHELVNAVAYARLDIQSHLKGGTPDWVHLLAVLEGRSDAASQAHFTPNKLESLERRTRRDKDRDQVVEAVLECVTVLRLLESRSRKPGGENIPFSHSIKMALERFEKVRERFTWIIHPDKEVRP